MDIATLITILQDDFAKHGNVTVYIDERYPVMKVGMCNDGSYTIDSDEDAIR